MYEEDIDVDNVEVKHFDLPTTVYNVESGGNPFACFTPASGYLDNQRVGQKVLVTGMEIRGSVYAETAAQKFGPGSQQRQSVRLMIIYDKQSDDFPITLADILTDSPNPTVYSPYNVANMKRFEIVYDKQWTLDPYYRNTTSNVASACHVNVTKKIKINLELNHPVVFNAPAAGFASITHGCFWIYWLGELSAADLGAEARMTCRTWYLDQ